MYDFAIIGSGPAGYTAAIYAVRYKMKVVVIGNQEGGQGALAHDVENYPGFESIKGPELMMKMKSHAEKFGTETKMDEVSEIIKNEDGTFLLPLAFSGETISAKTVLLAVGTKHRKLNAKGEDRLYGKGVTYCATCDGFFFRGKNVAVVGGGDSAATSALYLAEMCPKVYVLVRGDKMKAEPIWVEKMQEKSAIEIIYNCGVEEFLGEQKLTSVALNTGKILENVEGCFVEIGSDPNMALVEKFDVQKDRAGYLLVERNQAIPQVPGLFAAGDVTSNSNHFHQIATAVGEGAVAANSAFEYVSKN